LKSPHEVNAFLCTDDNNIHHLKPLTAMIFIADHVLQWSEFINTSTV